jgi:predicted transcriptional regulator
MDSKDFRKIRTFLGKTQEQLARWLCVSPKTIQSYEQGWRTVPAMIERQVLLFSAMLSVKSVRSFQDTNGHPCWETKNCPDKWKANCIVW